MALHQLARPPNRHRQSIHPNQQIRERVCDATQMTWVEILTVAMTWPSDALKMKVVMTRMMMEGSVAGIVEEKGFGVQVPVHDEVELLQFEADQKKNTQIEMRMHEDFFPNLAALSLTIAQSLQRHLMLSLRLL